MMSEGGGDKVGGVHHCKAMAEWVDQAARQLSLAVVRRQSLKLFSVYVPCIGREG